MSEPFINKNYTETNYRSGYHSYHHSGERQFNTPIETPERPAPTFFMGSEIEMAFPSDAKRAAFCDTKTNWYSCESDGSLSGVAPMELITIPLHPDDATNPDFWKPLCDKLSSMGARSWGNTSTGHHVHLSRSFFVDPKAPLSKQYVQSRTAVKKLEALYALIIEDNESAHRVFGRKKCYSQRKMKDQVVEKLREAVPDLLTTQKKLYRLVENAVQSTSSTRTREINVNNKHTVEFRMGKGSICAPRIAAINEFVLLFSRWCSEVQIGADSTLEKFEQYMREHVRSNSWLLHFYFNEPSPDGKKKKAPAPRTRTESDLEDE